MSETTFDRVSADFSIGLLLLLVAVGFAFTLDRTDYATLCGGMGTVLILHALAQIRAAGEE